MPGRNFTSENGYRYGFNGKEKDDEVKGNGNSLDFGGRIYDSRLGRWLSIDKLASQYPHISPYVFVKDNPLYFIDPDGQEVKISGADAQTAATALQTKTSLKLHYDVKTQMLTCTGKPKTALDQKLFDAIKDQNVTVNVKTIRANKLPMEETSQSQLKGKKANIAIGMFDGSKVGADGKVETSQFVNIKQAEILEKAGGQSVGTSVVHEVLESYIGAQDKPGMKAPIGPVLGEIFNKIHGKAEKLDTEFQTMSSAGKGPGVVILPNGKTVDIKVPDAAATPAGTPSTVPEKKKD